MHAILISRGGREYSIQDSAAPIWGVNRELQGVVLVFSDITESRRLAAEATHQAAHDPLTGLVNRREFEKRLQRILDTARVDNSEHVLCYVDLDQFKVINDTCGHTAGDELLRQLSTMLLDQIRKRDTFARLGGDEFGILMEHCSVQQGKRVADGLHETISSFKFTWEEQSFSLGASMGLVPITPSSESTAELLRLADTACYAAKEGGRNRIHIYRDDDLRVAERHGEMQWVARIQRALAEDRFLLYYQPIRAIGASTAEGLRYELLLRMQDEDGGIVLPGAFLPAAERYDLATPVDRWVINRAFGWLESQPAHLEALTFCAINLSGQSLADVEFLSFVERRFAETAVPPTKICFEVTETAAIRHLGQAVHFFTTLQGLGCKFALDDFGSGLSSFAYLKNLPVDYLKIDGGFVKDIAADPINFAMVKSISEIARVMEKGTIAESVDNDAILEKLGELKVDYAQGFGIARPRPLEEILTTVYQRDGPH